MLASFFDIPPGPAAAPAFGKKGRGKASPVQPARRRARTAAPKPTEASTTTVHAAFEPLPPERGAPRPAEGPGQPWQALAGSGVTRDDDIAEFRADWWEAEADAAEEMDDVSEPDFEPESLDPLAAEAAGAEDSVASSLDEDVRAFFSRRGRGGQGRCQAAAVYSGPQLRYEDDDWD